MQNQPAKPILVSGPLIRPVLSGLKTETRRLTGLDTINENPDRYSLIGIRAGKDVGECFVEFLDCEKNTEVRIKSPYGGPGCHLWVRENYFFAKGFDNLKPSQVLEGHPFCFAADGDKPEWAGKLRPSIFMPQWLSRITLKVTDLDCQPLQGISEESARREGFDPAWMDEFSGFQFPARTWFMNTWAKLNGPASAQLNPWVWVVNFTHLKS